MAPACGNDYRGREQGFSAWELYPCQGRTLRILRTDKQATIYNTIYPTPQTSLHILYFDSTKIRRQRLNDRWTIKQRTRIQVGDMDIFIDDRIKKAFI